MTRLAYDPHALPPRREDGSPYPLVGVFDRRHAWVGECAADLLGALIDGYDRLPAGVAGEPEALQLRWHHAVNVANNVQQTRTAEAANQGQLDLKQLDEADLTLLFADRANPVDVDMWELAVPLVVLTTDYAPYSSRTPPDGRVVWIDPSDEMRYLRSLGELGLIEFYTYRETARSST